MTRFKKAEGQVVAIGLAVSMGFATLVACAPAEPKLPTLEQAYAACEEHVAAITPDDAFDPFTTSKCQMILDALGQHSFREQYAVWVDQ